MPSGILDGSQFGLTLKGATLSGGVEGATNYDLLSRGKNLFGQYVVDKMILNYGVNYKPLFFNGELAPTHLGESIWIATIKVKPNTKYSISRYLPPTMLLGVEKSSQTSGISNSNGELVISYYQNPSVVLTQKITNIMLVEGDVASYEPYQEDTASITLPRPMAQLQNGISDEIDDDLIYNANRYVLKSTDIQAIGVNNLVQYVVIKQVTLIGMLPNIDSEGMATSRTTPLGSNPAGSTFYAHYINPGNYVFTFPLNTYADVNEAKADLIGTIVYYQLAQPATIHDGEQGYQAPTSIKTFKNGNLTQIGTHEKIYTLSNQDTITVPQKLIDIDSRDYGVWELDKNQQALNKISGVTLSSDGLTLTLPSSIDKSVLVKAELDPGVYLNNELHGNVPSNIGTAIGTNSDAIAKINKEINRINNELDLIIVATI
ncbi:hypothetical protein MHBO_001014 [Bonamia ostreae]|uniref:Uncharacterized protein n=1 Tax=Bonamia ostreae TaxID=126728 RepID=A0ABV2AHK7_9EUKA